MDPLVCSLLKNNCTLFSEVREECAPLAYEIRSYSSGVKDFSKYEDKNRSSDSHICLNSLFKHYIMIPGKKNVTFQKFRLVGMSWNYLF